MEPAEPNANDWPLFVISLPDAVARRDALMRDCARFGLSPIVVTATDGRKGLPPDLEHRVDREAASARVGRALADAEFACALSHQDIYRRIVRDGLPGAIILEDDAILTPLFAAFVRGRGYLAADLIQMDHMDARVRYAQRRRWSDAILLIPVAENASLTTGYSLSQRGAAYLLAHSVPVAGLADWPCETVGLGALVTLPRIVDHPPISVANSAIESGRLDLERQRQASGARWKRFGRADYWRRWWFKRRTRKIS